jgi:cysteine desulfurase/selenocysteine lyase
MKLKKLVTGKTRILAVNHVSNSLGTINPVKEIIDIAHKYNVPVLIDGAQAVSHIQVDVQELDCDFYCFSGHKMYAPMGNWCDLRKRKMVRKYAPISRRW